jgi:hypothetical protein
MDVVLLTARVRAGSRRVELDFGRPVCEVSCSRDEARAFAASARRLVHQHFGDTRCNTWNQPFRLKAERNGVTVFLPEQRDRMAVNPDVVLGFATRLEQTANWGEQRYARKRA